MPVIRYERSGTDASPYDAEAMEALLPDPRPGMASYLRMYAYGPAFSTAAQTEWRQQRAGWRFPHHVVSDKHIVGAASVRACLGVIEQLREGELTARMTRSEIEAAYEHVAAHLKDAGIRSIPALDRPASAVRDKTVEPSSATLPDNGMRTDNDDCGCRGAELSDEELLERAGWDESPWDGPAAMSSCAKSSTPASCYQAICAGKRAGDPSKQESWALPYKKTPSSAPNIAGVRNALARLPGTQGLINKSAAQAKLNGLMVSYQKSHGQSKSARTFAPRENLYRVAMPAVEFRDAAGARTADGNPALGVLNGHFSVFRQWTEIDSFFEGRFMEQFAPGAFTKTIKEQRGAMRCLFQHGRDQMIGSKPLGEIVELREDDQGAYYEVNLFDTSYNRDLIPGLKAKTYGASFRFRVVKEEVNEKPERSATNPDGIPERTVTEAQVMEFGPVTFPAYAGATAGIRSLTDEMLISYSMGDPERARQVLQQLMRESSTPIVGTPMTQDGPALSDTGAGEDHSAGESRGDIVRGTLVVTRNPNRRS